VRVFLSSPPRVLFLRSLPLAKLILLSTGYASPPPPPPPPSSPPSSSYTATPLAHSILAMVRTLVLALCVVATAATSSPPHHLFQQASSLVDDDAWWQRHGIKAARHDDDDSRVGTLGGILKAFALAARARGARMGGADNTGPQVRFIRVPDATADGPGPFPALGVLMVSDWREVCILVTCPDLFMPRRRSMAQPISIRVARTYPGADRLPLHWTVWTDLPLHCITVQLFTVQYSRTGVHIPPLASTARCHFR
jgi:hypothetical protein